MGLMGVIGLSLQLLFTILARVFKARDEAKAEDREFKMEQKEFLKMANEVVVKMLDGARQDNSRIPDVDDQIDRDRQ